MFGIKLLLKVFVTIENDNKMYNCFKFTIMQVPFRVD